MILHLGTFALMGASRADNLHRLVRLSHPDTHVLRAILYPDDAALRSLHATT